MTTQLLAAFDRRDEAEQACRLLEEQGISRSMVRMSDASGDSASAPGAGSADGKPGFFARLFGLDDHDERTGHYAEAVRRGSTLLTVDLDDDSRVDGITRLLDDAGAVDIDQRAQQWRAGGYAGYDDSAPMYTPEQVARERQTLQVMQEELEVGKRQVQAGGVRVHRRVTEQPVSEQVTLREERAVVERHPVDRPATEGEISALDARDATLEIRETVEEPVVAKTARVVEEISLGKEARERTETVSDTVRRADVDIEQLDGLAAENASRVQRPDGQRPQAR